MKKTLLTVLLATASAITFADGSFTGAGLEVGAGATKSDVRNVNLNEKTKGDVAVRGSYNTQFGQQLHGYCRLPLQIIFFKQAKVV